MNKEGIETPQQVPWSDATTSKASLPSHPASTGVSPMTRERDSQCCSHTSAAGSPGFSQPSHISFDYYHAQVPGPPENLTIATARNVWGLSPVLGPQEAAAACASCIPGLCCSRTTGDVRVSADFPGQLAVITAWRVTDENKCRHILLQGCSQEGFPIAVRDRHLNLRVGTC